MSEKVTVYVDPDDDPENPAQQDSNWRHYSFSSRHYNYKHPERLGLSLERDEDGLPVVEDEELKQKLGEGLAFFLSYYEHGACAWSLLDQGPKCQFDSTRIAGLLVWENDPEDLGAKTYEDRAKDAAGFLETYTKWCNGWVYGYRLEDPTGVLEESGCSGFYDLDEMFREIKRAVGDREVAFTGRAEDMVRYHWPPKGGDNDSTL